MTAIHPVRAWPAWARALAALLVATSRATPPLVALVVVRGATLEPPALAALLVGFAALPAVAAAALGRAFRATLARDADALRIARSDARFEIDRAAIARVVPWRIPLPGAGVTLRLRAGGCAPVGLEPIPEALRGEVAGSGVAAWDLARRDAPLTWARAPLVRFGLFPLLPAAGLFRAHQVIGFGGLFGQIHLESFAAWAGSLAETCATTALGLYLYASVLLALLEPAAFAATLAAPRRATAIRRATEWLVALLYYAGAPGFLLLRFLA